MLDGNECSVLKEDLVKFPPSGFFMRTAIKSKCKEPVTYAIAMHKDDWNNNIELVYNEVSIDDCLVYDDSPNVVECLIRLTPEHPNTGWQLKSGVYGIQWAHRVD